MAKRTADTSAYEHGSHPSKRRKDAGGNSSAEDYGSESEYEENENSDQNYGKFGSEATKEGVKQAGLDVLRMLTVTKSKDGRLLASLFHDQPSRRDYADYYNFTKHPIALNDIKKKLLSDKYKAHEDVKADFDLCFENAKAYNVEGSDIYADADAMQQIVSKEYSKTTLGSNDMQVDVEEEVIHEDPKKSKERSLHHLLKSRLKQLLAKTNEDTGRVLAGMFMDLPSKKTWANYYDTIKHPIAFDLIQKRVKKKEYKSASSFADDVELVFSNAMTFNADGSQIYSDAVTLRDIFRQLMSDLPAPYNLPQYQKSTTKIKLRLPGAKPAPTTSTPIPPEPKASSPIVADKVEDITKTASAPPATFISRPPSPKLPSTSSIQPRKANVVQSAHLPLKAQQLPSTPAQAPRTRAAEAAAAGIAPQPDGPQSVYSHAPSLRSLAAITATLPPAPVTSKAPPPPPAPHYHYLLKQAHLETQPRGRSIPLSSTVGVINWVIQLGSDEQTIVVSDIDFVANEDEEESSDEEDLEEDEDDDISVGNGKKKGSKAKRGRGRPPKAPAKLKSKTSPTKKRLHKLGEIQVKLDGQTVNEVKGDWTLLVHGATHILEIGEKEGMTWKIHIYRLP